MNGLRVFSNPTRECFSTACAGFLTGPHDDIGGGGNTTVEDMEFIHGFIKLMNQLCVLQLFLNEYLC